MRILLVEDSRRLREHLGRGLRAAGYAVDCAPDGEEGLWLAESNLFDIIVLDLMLPKMDGLTVLGKLKAAGCPSQVLILSAKDSVQDRVKGLSQGADDYLVKPFALDELIARVQALARRRYHVPSPTLLVGDLSIDMARREVKLTGQPVPLPPREYSLLEYLALRRGELVTRTEIESHIYDERAEPSSNVVDAAVYSLRKKLHRAGRRSLIRTRRGQGYILEP